MSTSIKNQIKNTIAILKDHICRRIDVVDNLSSTSIDLPLSANQGKVLQNQISKLNTDKSVAITKDTSKASFFLCDARKYGKLVILSAKFALNAALSSGYVIIANVADQENFSVTQINAYGNREDSGNAPFRVATDTNGDIAIQYLGVALQPGIMYCFSITWITG